VLQLVLEFVLRLRQRRNKIKLSDFIGIVSVSLIPFVYPLMAWAGGRIPDSSERVGIDGNRTVMVQRFDDGRTIVRDRPTAFGSSYLVDDGNGNVYRRGAHGIKFGGCHYNDPASASEVDLFRQATGRVE
jgi:hypothetical protein